MIVGVVGTIGSGKGIFSRFLGDKSFRMFAFGDEVRSFVDEESGRGDKGRKNLQFWGNEARVKFGEGFWAKRLVSKIDEKVDCVIDGFRYPDQIEVFRKTYGDNFCLVGVDAPEDLRFKWLKARGREGFPKTLEEFNVMNGRDLNGFRSGSGQHTGACVALADKDVFNDGSLEDFELKVVKIIGDICKKAF